MCAAYRGELLPTHSAVEVGTLQQLPQCPFHHTVAEMLNDLGDNLRGERFGIISHNYSATFTVMACLFFNSCTMFFRSWDCAQSVQGSGFYTPLVGSGFQVALHFAIWLLLCCNLHLYLVLCIVLSIFDLALSSMHYAICASPSARCNAFFHSPSCMLPFCLRKRRKERSKNKQWPRCQRNSVVCSWGMVVECWSFQWGSSAQWSAPWVWTQVACPQKQHMAPSSWLSPGTTPSIAPQTMRMGSAHCSCAPVLLEWVCTKGHINRTTLPLV